MFHVYSPAFIPGTTSSTAKTNNYIYLSHKYSIIYLLCICHFHDFGTQFSNILANIVSLNNAYFLSTS